MNGFLKLMWDLEPQLIKAARKRDGNPVDYFPEDMGPEEMRIRWVLRVGWESYHYFTHGHHVYSFRDLADHQRSVNQWRNANCTYPEPK